MIGAGVLRGSLQPQLPYKKTAATSNLAVGARLPGLVDGIRNIALGESALDSVTAGNNNVAIGYRAMAAFVGGAGTGGDNTAVGTRALESAEQGVGAVAVGMLALNLCTTGANNTAVGDSALRSVTTGSGNVAMGYVVAEFITTGSENVAIGRGSLIKNTTGDHNVVVGCGIMSESASGVAPTKNVAMGHLALRYNASQTNTAIGHMALMNGTSFDNVALGAYAGFTLTGGFRNVFIGEGAGNDPVNQLPGVNFSIAIGARSFTTKNNQCVLGADNIVETILRGLVCMGGNTSSFPALKRASTVLQARLANDSDFAPLQAILRAHATAVSGAVTPSHFLYMQDAAGTWFKVPAQPL